MRVYLSTHRRSSFRRSEPILEERTVISLLLIRAVREALAPNLYRHNSASVSPARYPEKTMLIVTRFEMREAPGNRGKTLAYHSVDIE